ncbi:uncharacterized protein LAESUDRAFT_762277 [Laetiporus sulphureus 93-53]|uniref:Uncharacterized protein n=1 Tax=Laetiporus sulphureus 93-53 TaxID=1314785 RepID=A0A165CMH1_9APHY|nr:uncharacterized protein LAESUDRAFT_762277 [Laetiporus sulphureus 93-53]KZT03078.1 hypothetical protein LAESUDRAFT_762277 [Laetiporus sulphureus 93-53]
MPRGPHARSHVPGRIPKPRAKVIPLYTSRLGNKSLREQMGISEAKFEQFLDIVRVCASIHLDHSKRITCQEEHDLANHYDEVKLRWPDSERYLDMWPVHIFTQKYLAQHVQATERSANRSKAQCARTAGISRKATSMVARPITPNRERVRKMRSQSNLEVGAVTSKVAAPTSSVSAVSRRTVSSQVTTSTNMSQACSSSSSRLPTSTAMSVTLRGEPCSSARMHGEELNRMEELYKFLSSLKLPLGHLLLRFVSSGIEDMTRLCILASQFDWEHFIEHHITNKPFELLVLKDGFAQLTMQN